jgi:hypothetical protein
VLPVIHSVKEGSIAIGRELYRAADIKAKLVTVELEGHVLLQQLSGFPE